MEINIFWVQNKCSCYCFLFLALYFEHVIAFFLCSVIRKPLRRSSCCIAPVTPLYRPLLPKCIPQTVIAKLSIPNPFISRDFMCANVTVRGIKSWAVIDTVVNIWIPSIATVHPSRAKRIIPRTMIFKGDFLGKAQRKQRTQSCPYPADSIDLN